MSLPLVRDINPKPFRSSKNFTVPVSLDCGGMGEADEFGAAGISLRGAGVDIADDI